jgi:hypothetical protein
VTKDGAHLEVAAELWAFFVHGADDIVAYLSLKRLAAPMLKRDRVSVGACLRKRQRGVG